MAEGVGKGYCGNPESVERLGETCGQTASQLERLRASLEQTASETVLEEKWCGPASQGFLEKARTLFGLLGSTSKECASMKSTLHMSAGMLRDAKGILDFAEVQARPDLYIGDDLVVKPLPGVQNPSQARIGAIQQMVYQSRAIAEKAHEMIARQNAFLETVLKEQIEEVGRQAVNLSQVGKAAGGALAAIRAGRRLVRRGDPLARVLDQVRNAPRNRIGGVQPPPLGTDGKLTTSAGNIMHDRIWNVVKQRYPNLQFDPRPPSQVKGPDMRVTGRAPGTPDPGFDWIEIKPESDIETFVNDQWGNVPDWTGRGRLVTYDNLGNVYEVDYHFN